MILKLLQCLVILKLLSCKASDHSEIDKLFKMAEENTDESENNLYFEQSDRDVDTVRTLRKIFRKVWKIV